MTLTVGEPYNDGKQPLKRKNKQPVTFIRTQQWRLQRYRDLGLTLQ